MRKRILVLIMAVVFAAAALVPATASAGFKVCVVHNEENEIVVSFNAFNTHLGHGDVLCETQP